MAHPLRYGVVFKKDNLYYLMSSSTFRNPVVEGDYNTWTAKWVKSIRYGTSTACTYTDLPISIYRFLYPSYYYLHAIDDLNDVIHLRWLDSNEIPRYGIFNIEDFSLLLLTATSGVNVPEDGSFDMTFWTKMGATRGGGISRSIQTYTLIQTIGTTTYGDYMNVYRSYERLWSHGVNGDLPAPQNTDATIETLEISPTGKYIIATTNGDVSGDPWMYYCDMILYEGSYVE